MTDYSDDRYGCMRVHIAARRGELACSRFRRNTLRSHAKAHGLRLGSLRKTDLAWQMAQHGLIDANGYLRDGFPVPGAPGKGAGQ
ncbi:hypothetical protein HMPREF0063_10074 [Aeromicrobium marinum DSM 15272]|uniref:Uncharacterized protein n=1 Tax=Aeromicrobium marinum DSM 15272 TaxID=585531 RepID=E2S7R7_9ACTN|nr:hypothetical protein HMPREF0063_10074 [Aeromicrobium marinum DSM 15272]